MEASPPTSQKDAGSEAEDACPGKDRRFAHNASSKVNLVVQRMLFPLLDSPMRTHVLLDAEADQLELDLLDQVGRHKPALMEDQQSFLKHLQSLLERYRRANDQRGGYSTVHTGAAGS
jgi:hypothetical protein